MARTLFSFLVCLPLVLCGPLNVQFRKHQAIYGEYRNLGAGSGNSSAGPGEPLFLTPYIEKGEIDKGIYVSCNISRLKTETTLQEWSF